MFKSGRFTPAWIAALGIAGTASLLHAQGMPVEGPAPTTALVYAESKGNAPLDPHSLQVQVNGHPVEVTGVVPVAEQRSQVAILIDSGIRTAFNLQFQEIEKFVNGLPAGTEVLVGYMENGIVRQDTGFTTDRERVLKSLHIPISVPGISASPYFCLSDFVKKWPSQERAARFVLMITNGVDLYNGSTSPLNQDSPYVEAAQNDAARAGVAVYSIYFQDAGFRGGRGSFSGQSYLAQVAEATGGQLLDSGPISPVTIAPYFNEFSRAMRESYLVTFLAGTRNNKSDRLERLKVKTSQQGVKIHAPEVVHPGLAE